MMSKCEKGHLFTEGWGVGGQSLSLVTYACVIMQDKRLNFTAKQVWLADLFLIHLNQQNVKTGSVQLKHSKTIMHHISTAYATTL